MRIIFFLMLRGMNSNPGKSVTLDEVLDVFLKNESTHDSILFYFLGLT
jgi:hypothetical protein